MFGGHGLTWIWYRLCPKGRWSWTALSSRWIVERDSTGRCQWLSVGVGVGKDGGGVVAGYWDEGDVWCRQGGQQGSVCPRWIVAPDSLWWPRPPSVSLFVWKGFTPRLHFLYPRFFWHSCAENKETNWLLLQLQTRDFGLRLSLSLCTCQHVFHENGKIDQASRLRSRLKGSEWSNPAFLTLRDIEIFCLYLCRWSTHIIQERIEEKKMSILYRWGHEQMNILTLYHLSLDQTVHIRTCWIIQYNPIWPHPWPSFHRLCLTCCRPVFFSLVVDPPFLWSRLNCFLFPEKRIIKSAPSVSPL